MAQFSLELNKDQVGQKTTAILENGNWTTPIRPSEKRWRDSFAGAALDSGKWDIIQTGSGQSITVAAGELKIATGVAINASTIIQSKEVFSIPTRTMFGFMISQKIVNQDFWLELISVDSSGTPDGLHAAAWRISGSDNLTNDFAVYEVQNGGAARLASAAIDTNAAHTAYTIYEIELSADECWFHTRTMDGTGSRVSSFVRHQQIPDPNALFKIRIRAANKATAPASTTDLKLQFVNVLDYTEVVTEPGRGATAAGMGQTVYVANSVSISGTPSIVGPAAHDAAISGNPVRIAGRAMTANYTGVATGEVADFVTTVVGAQVTKPFSIPELDWVYAPAAVIANTTDVVLKAAGAAGIRNYITSIQLKNTNATATEVVIKDGATVIWRGHVGASMVNTDTINFSSPLKTTAATALNFACITTAASVYVNAQGYQAP
jgi:hypothetical protein